MPKERFILFIIGTAIEALFFSMCVFHQDWLFAAFFGFFLLRRLIVSYRLDRFLRKSGLF